MRYVYIMLTRSTTKVGAVARFFTHYEFSHISISLTNKLDEFYSFSRLNAKTPLVAGFVKEYRKNYTFGTKDKTRVKVYEIPVTEEEYENIQNLIREFSKDKEIIFNLFSMLTTPMLKGFKVYKSYNCLSFVGLVLSKIENITLAKKYYKYTPKEFDSLLRSYLYLDGYLKNDTKERGNTFFDEVNRKEAFLKSCVLIIESLYRIIFKKSCRREL